MNDFPAVFRIDQLLGVARIVTIDDLFLRHASSSVSGIWAISEIGTPRAPVAKTGVL